jgi:hypothetical protein
MNRSFARASALGLALLATVTVSRTASAQGAPGVPGAPGPLQCNDFLKLRDDAEKTASAVQAAHKRHVDRQELCTLVTRFAAAETLVVKFLENNKTWCGVPDQAVAASKANHANTMKFRDTVCAEGPKPKPPTLSGAISTPTVDTAKNTKTGPGTFDTLTGNPLAK